MADLSSRCRACAGRDGTNHCVEPGDPGACGEFVSWRDYFVKQAGAAERALKETYVAATLLLGVAAASILLAVMR